MLRNKRILAVLALVVFLVIGALYQLYTISPQERPADVASVVEIDYPEERDRGNPWEKPVIPGEEPVITDEPAEQDEYQQKSGTLRVALRKEVLVSEQANEDMSMRFTRKTKERELVPGLVFTPGEGISVKLPDEDERIHIQRDNGQYEVLWKKKY